MRVRLLTFIVVLIALCVAASPALAAPKKSQVKFAQTTYSVPENGSTATVRIVRSGNLNATSTVQLSIDGSSTATAGVNYSITQPGTLAPGSPVTVTFNPKDTAKDINVAITDNQTANAPNKTIVFKIGSPNVNTQIKGATATLTIVDNEGPGTLDFTSPTYSVVEGGGRATVTVTRIGASNLVLSVDYATLAAPVGDPNPSATIGSDYTLTTGTLTFNAGETVKTIQVPITDDQLGESSEDFQVSLTNAKNLSGGAAPQIGTNVPALVTINDDDVSTYSFSSSLFSVNEDVASGHATITVNRGGATNIPSSVAYSTSNGTALVGADYTAAVGTLNFAAGETSKTFDVPVTNDGASEANETVNLTLTVNAQTVATSQLSIVDNDNPKGSVQFSDVSYNVNEDGTSATVTVTLSHAVDADVTVDYATSDGTATAGQDYTAASGTLTFVGNLNNGGAGQTSKTFSVPISDDSDSEDPETINLTLSNVAPVASSLAGAPGTATLTINDDDPAGNLEFESLSYNATEASGMATVTVHRTGGANGDVTVDYAASDGTATTADSDYTATTGRLTLLDGQTTKTFVVPITWDSRAEGPETINLELTNPLGGSDLGSNDASVIKVADDGASGPVTLSSAAYSVGENGGLVTISATRSGGSLGGGAKVDYATSDGSAAAGSDYTATSGTLTFGPGETTKSFTVPVADDSAAEGDETFGVALSNAAGGATLGSPAAANVTITDNDAAAGTGGPQSSPGNPNPAGSQTAAGDKTAPKLTVSAKKIQKALKAKLVALSAKCNENCKFAVTLKVKVGKKNVALGKAAAKAAAGKSAKIKVKLSKKSLAALVKALGKAKGKLTLTVVAKDAAGNKSSATRAVTVKR